MPASALQLADIAVDKIHPVGNDGGQVEPVAVFIEIIRGILGNQDRQAGAGAEVIGLAAADDHFGQIPLRFSGGICVKLRICIQNRAEVHHIPASVRKGTEGVQPAPAAADIGQMAVRNLSGHDRGKLLHAAFQRTDFGQINRAERQVVVRIILKSVFHEAVNDCRAEIGIRYGRIILQHLQPAGIVPAGAGLQLLAGDVIIDIVMRQHCGHLIGGHHAGIASEDIDMVIRNRLLQAVQDAVDFHNGQPVVVGGFIKADTAFGAGTVIPQHYDHPVGGILGHTVFQEFLQAFGAAHGSLFPLFEFFEISVPDDRQVPGVAFQVIDVPF